MGIQAALRGRWERRAGKGTIAQLGLRKLQDCSSKGGGVDQVKRTVVALKTVVGGYLALRVSTRGALPMELALPDSVTVAGQYAPRDPPISARCTQYIWDLGNLNSGLHVYMLNM